MKLPRIAEHPFFPFGAAIVLAIIAAPFAISGIDNGYKTECAERWQYSGMNTRFERGMGCLVETSAGIWIREERVFMKGESK